MVKRANVTNINFGPSPHYVATFDGTKGRIHPRGHIWLTDETALLSLPFQLQKGFRFANPDDLDATGPMFLSTNPNGLDDFYGGEVFDPPTLTPDNTGLTLTVKKFDSQKYFYVFNIVRLSNGYHFPIADPIIINKIAPQ